MNFEKHLTSCLYKLSGFYHAFSKIDFAKQLVYLDEGGNNPIPVRLTDLEKVQVMGLGELKVIEGKYEWVKY